MGAVAAGAGAVVDGIGKVINVGVRLGTVLFDLTKEASDYGSSIFEASQKTGLGAVSG